MIKMVSLKCPECKANLSIEEDRTQCFCQYCGAKILVDDGTTVHMHRTIDEARIKEAEIKERIKLKELEFEEKKYLDMKRAKSFKVKLSVVLAVIGVSMIIFGYMADFDNSFMFAVIGTWMCLAIAFLWNDNNKKE